MQQRFEVLDAFRGIFAFFIVYHHLRDTNNFSLIENNFFTNSYLFVDFFFVISGFVIALNYQNSINTITELRHFFKKRLLRLLPLHLALMLVFVSYVIARQVSGFSLSSDVMKNTYSPESFITGIFFLNSVKFPGINSVSWNYPTWSISAEVISYFVFGLMLFCFKSLKKYIVYFYILVVATVLSAIYLFNDGIFILTYDNGFLRGMTGFFCGAIAFNIYRFLQPTLPKLVFSALEIIACVLVITLIIHAENLSSYMIVFNLLFTTTILIFAFQQGIVSQIILRINSLKKLAAISYSVYLSHMLILIMFDIAFKRFANKSQLIDGLITVLVTIIVYYVSSWTYENIEKRFIYRKSIIKPAPDMTKTNAYAPPN